MSKARIYARNLAAQWIAHGAGMVTAMFLSPFVVHTLTTPVYGVWSLMMVLTGYMGIFDLGVRASTGRYVIYYIGREEHDLVEQTIRTGMGLFSLVGGLVVGAGVVIGFIFPVVFSKVDPTYYGLLRVLMPVVAINVVLSMYAAVFASVLTAHDRFDLMRGVDLVVIAVRTAGTVLALSWGYGIAGMTAVLSLCSIIALTGNWLLARKVYPQLKAWPLGLVRDRVRELFSYGAWAFVYSISYRLVGMTDLVVIGVLIGPAAAGIYSVGAMLVYYSTTFLNHIGEIFFPPVQRSVARGEMGPARWLFLRQVRLGLVFGLPVFLGFIIFGQRFIRLWMLDASFGESSVAQAALVMGILSGAKLMDLMGMGSEGLLAALGRVRFGGLLTVVHALTNLGLSVFFVKVAGWGIMGVALGTLMSKLVVKAFILPWYACRSAGMDWRKFFLEIGGVALACGSVVVAAYLIVRTVVPGDSWVLFGLQVVLAILGAGPAVFFILVPASDRKRLLDLVLKGRLSDSRTPG